MLFEMQPIECRMKLPSREFKINSRKKWEKVIRRVIEYDPTELYERLQYKLDPISRHQKGQLCMEDLFPKKSDKFCDCGCGMELTGKRTRWASNNCSEFGWYIWAIITGRLKEIRICIDSYWGKCCIECGDIPKNIVSKSGRSRSGIEYDHIIPVYKGGGGCWLSNYRPLCNSCHKVKTKSDMVKS